MKRIGESLLFFALLTMWMLTLFVSVAELSSKTAYGDEPRPFGAGIVLGEPTGLTGKYWLGPRAALDFGVSYSFRSYMLVYSDYLWHFPGAFESGREGDEFTPRLSPYVGVGGGLLFGKDFRLDARVPLGVEWRPAAPTLGVFLEAVPAIRLAPEMAGDMGGGIGVRYYF